VDGLITGNVDIPPYRGMLGAGPDDDLGEAPHPAKHIASPTEVAAFVAFLLSDVRYPFPRPVPPAVGGAATDSCTWLTAPHR
jgi:hypothetical protein